tara:strand:+ start:987 stop:1193 length:207 start_codon:yes stop_codon:yes gene_type:complete
MEFHPTSDYLLRHNNGVISSDEEEEIDVCERISELIDKRVELEKMMNCENIEKELENIEIELHKLGWY